MHVGVTVFELHIPHSTSLKEKRMVVRSLRDRLQRRFRVSVAEVDLLDLHQRSRMATAAVSNDRSFLDSLFRSMEEFVEAHADAEVTGWETEWIQY